MSIIASPKGWRDPRGVLDPVDLARRLREITPSLEEQIEIMKYHAKRDRDALIELGGRPTRPIRTEPIWRPGPEDGELLVKNAELNQECNVLEEDLLDYHWGEESNKFEEELRQWKEFRKYQESNEHPFLSNDVPESASIDHQLSVCLNKVHDWRDFEAWQQKKVDRTVKLKEQCRRALDKLMQEADALEARKTLISIQRESRRLLPLMRRRQLELEASEKHIAWIKSQYYEISWEVSESLKGLPLLRYAFERRLAMQAQTIRECLEGSGLEHDLPEMCPNESADDHQNIVSLNSWISELLERAREWKKFSIWHQFHSLSDAPLDALQAENASGPQAVSVTYPAYLQREVEKAQGRLESWQRLLQWRQQVIKEEASELDPNDACLRYVGDVCANIVTAQKAVIAARTRLDCAQQSILQSRPSMNTDARIHASTKGGLPSPPETASASFASQLEDRAMGPSLPALSTGHPETNNKRKRSTETLGPSKLCKMADGSHSTPAIDPETSIEVTKGPLPTTATPELLQRKHVNAKAKSSEIDVSVEVPQLSRVRGVGETRQSVRDIGDSAETHNAIDTKAFFTPTIQGTRSGKKHPLDMEECLLPPAKLARNTSKKQKIDPTTCTKQQASLLIDAAVSGVNDAYKPTIPSSFGLDCDTDKLNTAQQELVGDSASAPFRRSERIKQLASTSLNAEVATSAQGQQDKAAIRSTKQRKLKTVAGPSPMVDGKPLRRSARLQANAAKSPAKDKSSQLGAVRRDHRLKREQLKKRAKKELL